MKSENNDKSSPTQLKEKIERLRQEMTKISEKPSQQEVKYEADPNEEGLTHINPQRNGSVQVIEELDKEIDLLLKDNLRLREEKLLVLADGENLKKRIHDEAAEIKRYRAAGTVEKLLPALDNFERALQVTNVAPEVKNFLTGFEMIYRMIKMSLAEEGVKEMETKIGEQFNSNLHSAIEIIETKEVKPGCIVKILQKGYMIHDRVLRHASVQVAK